MQKLFFKILCPVIAQEFQREFQKMNTKHRGHK
jgi:hypothetical protein